MVTSVPYQLRSSQIAREREERELTRVRAGDLRRGRVDRSPPTRPATRRAARARRRRTRASAGRAARSRVGERFEVEVGPVAHGGHCVARLPTTGRVVFVRHALPGRAGRRRGHRGHRRRPVLARRRRRGADAVAGPGRRRRARTPGPAAAAAATSSTSSLAAQRALKAAVVARAAAPAGRARPATSSSRPVPGDDDGLRLAHPDAATSSCPDGRRGLRQHRSHDVVAGRRLPDRAHAGARVEPPVERVDEPRRGATSSRSTADGFWQVHPGAPRVLVETVLGPARPAAGGAGARPLRRRRAVRARSSPTRSGRGPGRRRRGRPGALRGTPRRNLPRRRSAVDAGAVDRVLAPASTSRSTSSSSTRRARAPAGRRRAGRRPARRAPSRTSPATPPPWPATWRPSPSTATRCAALRAFDLFPMTHHVECVALLSGRAIVRV